MEFGSVCPQILKLRVREAIVLSLNDSFPHGGLDSLEIYCINWIMKLYLARASMTIFANGATEIIK